ncbi:23S rRNA (uracil(1939)-C(5))-methyltransferase RlmD [Geomonas sp. Red32]|uniref:23S rRNA (uracil(1939)-C(5))-methyltransferase RlmD n=1 Tax=Geomonas sp. Red32 TaxID=2912856 RepID=UPI00202CB9DE|nr:23S rRNA (uracil(1939)-C(5))-methyltransferase RlmD [Geomonas sp. Red32]MCM0081486.1 23S rRNA (uracil(1939)-C(5))-methyltransferase RlmD [Geomonas sp. Red32]
MADISVAIEKLCYGGSGLGRVEGKACFVPFTAPGDRARVRVVKEKRSYLEGELVELEVPSALRTAPPCPLFGVCGGCDWQHLPYPEQVTQKGEIFAESLRRIGKLGEVEILPVIASPNAFGYRSRIQIKIAREAGVLQTGFFMTGSHKVVDCPQGCPIAHPLLNRMTSELRPLLAGLAEARFIPQIDLSIGDDEQGLAVVHYRGGDAGALARRLSAARADLPSIGGLLLRKGERGAPEPVFGIEALRYRIPAGLLNGRDELVLRFSRGGFSQVNYLQNLQLIRTVVQWAALSGGERVLDLFCGNGNFSLPLAGFAREVVGVEGYAPSIEDAVANAAANGVANASFRVSDVAAAVRKLASRGERFDLVVLDPPRAGAEAAGEIARLRPAHIIYVSCDPATLARDLGTLCAGGYRVVRSQPVDMFPQTYHLESVTELVLAD